LLALVIAVSGCGDNQRGPPPDDVTKLSDASTALGASFRFAIVGDTRPANQDDVAGCEERPVAGGTNVSSLPPIDFLLPRGCHTEQYSRGQEGTNRDERFA
jgi:hypothetical protein